MNRTIRPADMADVPTIWKLVCELADYEKLTHLVTGNEDDLRRALTNEECWALVCEDDGVIVGYALGFRTFSTFRMKAGTWMEDLYVVPEHRGKGHGKAMLQHIERMSQHRGDGRLEWSVLDWNEPSIEFYKALGAEVLPDWRLCRITF